jgi:hypothetical protein
MGGEYTINLENGEVISSLQIRSADVIDRITFFTNKGNVYGPYGGDQGVETFVSLGGGLKGIYGSAGNYYKDMLVLELGFYY